MSRKLKPLDSAIVTAIVAVGAWAVIFAFGTMILASVDKSVDVAIGGLAAILNLSALSFIARGALGDRRRRGMWSLLGALKVIVLLGAVFLLVRSGIVHLFALLIGYGALPLGIVTTSFLRTSSEPEGEEAGDQSRDLVTAAPINPPGD